MRLISCLISLTISTGEWHELLAGGDRVYRCFACFCSSLCAKGLMRLLSGAGYSMNRHGCAIRSLSLYILLFIRRGHSPALRQLPQHQDNQYKDHWKGHPSAFMSALGATVTASALDQVCPKSTTRTSAKTRHVLHSDSPDKFPEIS